MTCATCLAVLAMSGVLTASQEAAVPQTERVQTPSFGTVTVYPPLAAPEEVVLFLSGDGGWNLGVVDMAERLRDAGALVVGIDIRAFLKRLDVPGRCVYPAGALEELSRAVQLRFKLPAYVRPMLAGYSSGATLVYAALAAAPPETFAGAISLGFCPDIEMRQPLCRMRGLAATKRPKEVGYDLSPFAGSTVPWMVLQGEADQVCSAAATKAFVAGTGSARLFSLPKVGHGFGVPARWASVFLEAYHAIANARRSLAGPARITTPAVADLSLVEVPAAGRPDPTTMAVVLSGDGGWADIDKGVADALATAGIPVVGWSSLDYYWTPRAPASAAADLARIIEHFTAAWQKAQVLVVGYSFGADVAPFLVNRLPAALRSRVTTVALLSPSDTAAFAFHLASWLGGGADPQYPTAPEIARLSMPVTCVSAADEPDSVCRAVTAVRLRAVTIGEGHHFGGEYGRLVDAILR
ncbi:MAG TPA: AcvB/VirJ family lysyl-phosphatidylglycerol hydrolase [Vicinamibacterales bacterium]|nr:AcvB/VirJ family lysyl-phosphatidylglycerol hydrolase [Vicinamibacterales bacterium]